MRGYPIRLEIGPKDIEKNQAVLVRRDTGEKEFVALSELETRLPALLEEIQQNLFDQAVAHREENTNSVTTLDEFKQILDEKLGYIKAMWCGNEACEDEIREVTGATSRCIPFEQEEIAETCVCCGEKAKEMVYWGRAY